MSLPTDFQFSQTSLQDFEICPRRFELRYLWRLSWPAVEAEPVWEAEQLARLGSRFHRLVHQHLIGLSEAMLTESLAEAEPELKTWWRNYLAYHPALAGAQTYPELTLATPVQDRRLMARFDLLARQPEGTFLIIDWKTARHKPDRDKLARRMQTRVYPYVLAAAGAAFNAGRAIDPAAIKMMYWYPQAPDQPEIFDYSPALFNRDGRFLSDLITQIKQRSQTGDFPLVADRKPCRHCVYRSFCDRGDRAGSVAALEEAPQETMDIMDLDWDQIAEIQF